MDVGIKRFRHSCQMEQSIPIQSFSVSLEEKLAKAQQVIELEEQ